MAIVFGAGCLQSVGDVNGEQKRGQVHLSTRGVGRRQLFETEADYDGFERIIAETLNKCPLRICGYCLMPNHWHFVMWPEMSSAKGTCIKLASSRFRSDD
ncbi:MAG: hypothetical protein CK530_13880 [Planctomycetaceae bacterium]|nr:MAG: hypothetical protein CK530_13880 [Planctomycetaceae bacterium]